MRYANAPCSGFAPRCPGSRRRPAVLRRGPLPSCPGRAGSRTVGRFPLAPSRSIDLRMRQSPQGSTSAVRPGAAAVPHARTQRRVDPCPLRVLARAQAAGNELLLNAATLNRVADRSLDQAGACLAITKDALGGFTQLGHDAQGWAGRQFHEALQVRRDSTLLQQDGRATAWGPAGMLPRRPGLSQLTEPVMRQRSRGRSSSQEAGLAAEGYACHTP